MELGLGDISKLKWHLVVLIVVLLVTSNCAKRDVDPGPDGEMPKVIGHRGMGEGNLWANNSLEAIVEAIDRGVHGVEMDVQLTADNQLVLFHDLELDRKSTCSGKVGDLTLKELRQCRIESLDKKVFIPALSDVFELIQGTDLVVFLDIKIPRHEGVDLETYFERLNGSLDSLMAHYEVDTNVMVEGNREFHEYYRSQFDVKKMVTSKDSLQQSIETALEIGAYGVGVAEKNTTKEEVQLAHDSGLKVMFWALNTKHRIVRGFNKNADFLQTDCINYTLKLTEEDS